jgi:hypothetical protein
MSAALAPARTKVSSRSSARLHDQPTPPRLSSIEETRRQLGGTARSRVYVLIGEGMLKTVKLGRRRFVTTESIDKLIDKLARRSAA